MSFQAKRITIIILVIATIALAGISVYIGVMLREDQAPTDSKAGGGGGDCCTTASCDLGEYVCCENLGHFPPGSCTESPCYEYPSECVGENINDAACQAVLDCSRTVTEITICGMTVSTTPGTDCPVGGNGSACGTPAQEGNTQVCVNGYCREVPPSQCFYYEDNILKCEDCGCPSKNEVCVNGATGVISTVCANCDNPIWYDCGQETECGNGTVEAGEQCDPPGSQCPNGETCTASCTCPAVGPYCGDGNLDAGEECDDGNNINGDGCSANCDTEDDEYCGDGVINEDEVCDFAADPTGCSTDEICTTDCICSSCGDPCDPANPECPVNTVCDSSTNRCVIDACLGNPNCLDNGCRLPETAIFNDSRDYVIYGLFLMLLGVFAVRYNILSGSLNTFGNMSVKYSDYQERKENSKREKRRDKYEKRFEK